MPRCSLVCIATPILKRGKSHSAPPFTRLMAVSAINEWPPCAGRRTVRVSFLRAWPCYAYQRAAGCARSTEEQGPALSLATPGNPVTNQAMVTPACPPAVARYGAEQGRGELRAALCERFYAAVGRKPGEVFVSDGSKCDIGRLQMMFGAGVSVAVQARTRGRLHSQSWAGSGLALCNACPIEAARCHERARRGVPGLTSKCTESGVLHMEPAVGRCTPCLQASSPACGLATQ